MTQTHTNIHFYFQLNFKHLFQQYCSETVNKAMMLQMTEAREPLLGLNI